MFVRSLLFGLAAVPLLAGPAMANFNCEDNGALVPLNLSNLGYTTPIDCHAGGAATCTESNGAFQCTADDAGVEMTGVWIPRDELAKSNGGQGSWSDFGAFVVYGRRLDTSSTDSFCCARPAHLFATVELQGGAKKDVLSFQHATSGSSYQLDRPHDSSGSPQTLEGRMLGGSGHDEMDGSDSSASEYSEFLSGQRGDDRVFGWGGQDQIHGGKHDDVLDGGDGTDHVWGGSGDDFITGGDDPDFLYGDDGWDTMHGQGGDDYMEGGAGIDFLWGWRGDDTLLGGDDPDYLVGELGDDILCGEGGDDTLIGDWLYAWPPGDDKLSGGLGTNNLDAQGGTDTCSNGAGPMVGCDHLAPLGIPECGGLPTHRGGIVFQ